MAEREHLGSYEMEQPSHIWIRVVVDIESLTTHEWNAHESETIVS